MAKTEPKQQRARRTYNAILDSVDELIRTKPSEKLTPRAVVLATGIPQGTVYRYFADVAEMRDALFERYMTQFQEEVRTVFETANPPNVVAAMETLFELILNLNRTYPVLLTLSLDPTTQSRARAVSYQRELIATAIADALVRKGLIAEYDKVFLDEIYLCVLVSASLTQEAFLWDPAGDRFVIDSGRAILRRQAEGFLKKSSVEDDHSSAILYLANPGARKERRVLHPGRVWNLSEVLFGAAAGFVGLGQTMAKTHSVLQQVMTLEGETSVNHKERVAVLWKQVARHLDDTSTDLKRINADIALPSAIAQVRRMQDYLSLNQNAAYLQNALAALHDRIQDELSGRMFYYVRPENLDKYNEQNLFGEKAAASFAHAGEDIEAAGKCLALGRSTAAVFHLMRVLEVGMRSLAQRIGIDFTPNWDAYIEAVRRKSEASGMLRSQSLKAIEPFLKDVLGDLVALKAAWKNPTLPFARNYSEEEAEDIFRSAKRLMAHLAEWLSEIPVSSPGETAA
jgi:AcrR family transcriptional regulator/HEPN domain-containing protein